MNEQQRNLWQRISGFPLDPEYVPYPFVGRLAQENHWSAERAHRVEQEYRRFAFLAVAVDHSVSPSDAVDQAWHQHILDTENYWSVFCPQVLGKPLHHHPSRRGMEESRRLDE